MSVSMQERLQRLRLGSIDKANPTSHSSQILPKWQQELNQYKQREEEEHNQATSNTSSYRNGPTSVSTHVQLHKSLLTSKNISDGTIQLGLDTRLPSASGSPGDDTLFIPKGKRKAAYNRSANEQDDSDSDQELEPVSSATELVGRFCLFLQVVKFPYKYLEDMDGKVSARFFSGGKAFDRAWKLHSITAPDDMGGKQIFFVPYEQVLKLINDINAELGLHIEVPPYPFTVSFYKDGTPQPDFLGTVNSKNDYDELRSSEPKHLSHTFADDVQENDRSSWREKIERSAAMESKKKVSAKSRNRERNLRIVLESCDQLKRLQRYFGLRPPLPTTSVIQPLSGNANDASKVLDDLHLLPGALDITQHCEYPFEDQSIIIAVDIESWEECHSMITEIGISTLDTADLIDLDPGQQGENWVQKIRSRHFRIVGREHMRNTKYCIGDPENFKFGQSEFIDIENAPNIVDSCFEWPFITEATTGVSSENTDNVGSASNVPASIKIALQRNLLLVGHDVTGDIDYLSLLGSEIFSTSTSFPQGSFGTAPSRRQRVLGSIRECLDTASLYKTLTHDTNTRSLSKICYDLGFTALHAHNAGNDARYTLEAFVKIAIQARQRDDAENTRAKENGHFNPRNALWEIEGEMAVQAKLQARREANKVALQPGAAGTGPAQIPPPRSPSPLFAPEGSTEYGDKLTFAEATRQYLDRWGGPSILEDCSIPDDDQAGTSSEPSSESPKW